MKAAVPFRAATQYAKRDAYDHELLQHWRTCRGTTLTIREGSNGIVCVPGPIRTQIRPRSDWCIGPPLMSPHTRIEPAAKKDCTFGVVAATA